MSGKAVSNEEFKKLLKEGWLVPAAMARRWGCSEQTVFMLMKQGKIKYVSSLSNNYRLLDPKQSKP